MRRGVRPILIRSDVYLFSLATIRHTSPLAASSLLSDITVNSNSVFFFLLPFFISISHSASIHARSDTNCAKCIATWSSRLRGGPFIISKNNLHCAHAMENWGKLIFQITPTTRGSLETYRHRKFTFRQLRFTLDFENHHTKNVV